MDLVRSVRDGVKYFEVVKFIRWSGVWGRGGGRGTETRWSGGGVADPCVVGAADPRLQMRIVPSRNIPQHMRARPAHGNRGT
jgi:hypothetical protein